MGINKQNIFTSILDNSTLLIKEEYGVTAVALKLTAGTASYIGSKRLGAVASVAIPLEVDKPVTVSAETGRFIDDFLIDATGGVLEIIAR